MGNDQSAPTEKAVVKEMRASLKAYIATYLVDETARFGMAQYLRNAELTGMFGLDGEGSIPVDVQIRYAAATDVAFAGECDVGCPVRSTWSARASIVLLQYADDVRDPTDQFSPGGYVGYYGGSGETILYVLHVGRGDEALAEARRWPTLSQHFNAWVPDAPQHGSMDQHAAASRCPARPGVCSRFAARARPCARGVKRPVTARHGHGRYDWGPRSRFDGDWNPTAQDQGGRSAHADAASGPVRPSSIRAADHARCTSTCAPWTDLTCRQSQASAIPKIKSGHSRQLKAPPVDLFDPHLSATTAEDCPGPAPTIGPQACAPSASPTSTS